VTTPTLVRARSGRTLTGVAAIQPLAPVWFELHAHLPWSSPWRTGSEMTTRSRILVVEDDHDVRESIREVLEDAGYHVTTAPNGARALAALREMPRPAVMLVDVMMAEMSGPELLRVCAADPNLARIPAVVISGADHGALELPHVHSFVPKPFNGEQLLEAVGRAASAG
jgi:CheY-like chemotaxis protein